MLWHSHANTLRGFVEENTLLRVRLIFTRVSGTANHEFEFIAAVFRHDQFMLSALAKNAVIENRHGVGRHRSQILTGLQFCQRKLGPQYGQRTVKPFEV